MRARPRPRARPPTRPRTDGRMLVVALVALGIAGVALRIWVLASPLGRPDSDEAVAGLMAIAIRHGHFSTYFWGQSYGSSIEPTIVAIVFAFTGTSTIAFKIVPIVLSAVASVLVWQIGRRTIGEPAARFAAVLYWAYPPAFLWGSTKERGFYQVGLVLVLAVVLVAIRVHHELATNARVRRVDLVVFGFLIGLAVWTTPQSAYVLAPVVAWLVVRTREHWRDHWRDAWPIVPAGLVGGLPWIAYVAGHGRSAFYQATLPTSYPERVKSFFADLLPRAFGGKIPESTSGYLGGSVGRIVFWALLVVAIVAVVRRARDDARRRSVEPLLLTAIAYPFLASVPRLSALTDEPRYALLLSPIVVLLLSWVVTTTTARVAVTTGAIALGVVFIASMLRWVDDRPQNEDVGPPDLTPAKQLLDRMHVDRLYADYWIAYRLTFDTDERVIASPVLTVRNDDFAAAVARQPTTPYLVYRGDVYDRRFGPALRRAGVGYRRVTAGEYALYLPDRRVPPKRFESIWLLDP